MIGKLKAGPPGPGGPVGRPADTWSRSRYLTEAGVYNVTTVLTWRRWVASGARRGRVTVHSLSVHWQPESLSPPGTQFYSARSNL